LLIYVISCSNFISTDQQPSPLDASVQLSAEEKVVAEQSLSVYCKPVEFYNFLYHRILQRTVRYVLHLIAKIICLCKL
jgi:hypothetical protein